MNSKCVQNNRFVHNAKFSFTDYAKITLSDYVKIKIQMWGRRIENKTKLDMSQNLCAMEI